VGEISARGTGLGEDTEEAVFPPGLTDVDLRTLRALDDPAALAAVAGVLADPCGLCRVWSTNPDDEESSQSEHAFSATPARPSSRGEDTVA
jgi:hypothetical protein